MQLSYITTVQQLCPHLLRMCLFPTFLLCAAVSLPVSAQLGSDVDTNPSELGSTPGYSASDCLSYIYVAWIYFIYTVGLGVQSTQFYQVEIPNIARLGTRVRKWTGKLLKYLTLNI